MIGHDELMRYLDGELPAERAREVEAALETSTELRREYVIFRRMKADLHDMGEGMEPERTVWDAVNRRLTRPIGWTLFLVGAVIWTGYGVYTYLTGAEALWEKLATSAVVVGLAMLLVSALVDRWRDLKTDPYKEIER
ncbi:MAG: zf-HC2 domain-containing protein [Longimicrobiales bacterium]|nr:zf-HC2 domain-containing protein [Longimicrobiales bacterium]